MLLARTPFDSVLEQSRKAAQGDAARYGYEKVNFNFLPRPSSNILKRVDI